MNKSILVIGSTCVDVIIRVDHLPRTQEDIHPTSQRFAVGGCAYNAANILQRCGAPVTFVTPVGGGVFGGFVREKLDALGVETYVNLPDSENGCCYCFVENTGERTFMSVHGAEYTFDPAWMTPYAARRFDYAYVCGLEIEEPTGEALTGYLERAPIGTLVYAPGPRGVPVPRERTARILALHPIVHLNEAEARAMSGCDDVDAAIRALHAATQNAVVVTLGADGVRFIENGEIRTLPAEPAANVVDTIGAGDAHAGAMLLGLSRGMALRDALAMANRVSCAVVQTDGATLSDADLARTTAK